MSTPPSAEPISTPPGRQKGGSAEGATGRRCRRAGRPCPRTLPRRRADLEADFTSGMWLAGPLRRPLAARTAADLRPMWPRTSSWPTASPWRCRWPSDAHSGRAGGVRAPRGVRVPRAGHRPPDRRRRSRASRSGTRHRGRRGRPTCGAGSPPRQRRQPARWLVSRAVVRLVGRVPALVMHRR